MPIYEYLCPGCECKFELMRPRSESKLGSACPQCGGNADRSLSAFSHYSAFAPNSMEKQRDIANEKMWKSQRKLEDNERKNPDPLKPWREERQKTLKVGPEKWTEWAKGEQGKKQKKKDYGENWLGRES